MYMYTCTSQVSGVARILQACIYNVRSTCSIGGVPPPYRQLEVVTTNRLSGVYMLHAIWVSCIEISLPFLGRPIDREHLD